MARVNVYVDGLNLYYGALRNSPYRWLDLRKLSRGLLKASDEVPANSLLHRVGGRFPPTRPLASGKRAISGPYAPSPA